MSVSKFTVLSAESLNPEHPLHDEFTARMDDIWENYSQYPWLIPPQLGSWKSSMRPVVRKAMEIMDGVQLWWLREPEVDLCKESGLRWKTFCFHPRCGMHIVDFKYLLRLALHARAKRRGSDGPSPFALTGLYRVVDVYMIY